MNNRHLAVLDWIAEYIGINGVSPIQDEIAKAFGFSKGVAFNIIQDLIEDGCLTTVPNTRRHLRVVTRTTKTLTEEEVSWCRQHPAAVRTLIKAFQRREMGA